MHHALLVCGAVAVLGAVAAWVLTQGRVGVAPAAEAAEAAAA
jgi:hypothetical protein